MDARCLLLVIRPTSPILKCMFKYTAHNPNSAFSVLAASFRLYFSSFLYSVILAVVASLTFLAANYIFATYFTFSEIYFSVIPGAISSILGLIFFIPLIKRIYSVGADLPITTPEAFRGFFTHFVRLVIFIVLTILLSMIVPTAWTYLAPEEMSMTWQIILTAIVIFIYVYIGLKIYFAPMFIVLENKHVWDALKGSFRIEHHHMWLTFCVLSLYFLGYWTVISFTSGYFVWEPLGVDLYTLVLSTLTLPLFLSIQICQFFNLKKLSK